MSELPSDQPVSTRITGYEPSSPATNVSSSIQERHTHGGHSDDSVNNIPTGGASACGPTDSIPMVVRGNSGQTQAGLKSTKLRMPNWSRLWQNGWLRKLKIPDRTRLWHDGWLWEIASILLSCACVIAVIVILSCAQGLPLQKWNFIIQPNSLVSIFMTIAKSAMLVPMSSCISQAMWVRYKQTPHHLGKLEDYNEASRGPWGSLQLLFHIRSHNWVTSLGAILTLLGLGIDPFTQQIIAYRSREVRSNSGTASLHVLREAILGSSQEQLIALKTTIRSNIFVETPPQFTCSTSNCRWPTFTSLGLCSTCENLTSKISPQCKTTDAQYRPRGKFTWLPKVKWPYKITNCTFSLPSHVSFSTYSQVISSGIPERSLDYAFSFTKFNAITVEHPTTKGAGVCSSDDNCAFRIIFYSAQPNIASFLDHFRAPPEIIPYELIDCDFYWCAQVYNSASIANGSSERLKPSESYKLAIDETKPPAERYLEPSQIPRNTSLDYTFPLPFASVVATSLSELFNYRFHHSGFANFESMPDLPNLNPSSYSLAQELWCSGNFTESMQRLARGLTNYLRNGQETIIGDAFTFETYVQVRWVWISLPLSVLVFSIVQLAMTMHRTRKHKVALWKSSSLALLFHGLHGWEDEDLAIGDVARMKQMAEQMRARLVDDGDKQLKFKRS